jgi:hypothetical protein
MIMSVWDRGHLAQETKYVKIFQPVIAVNAEMDLNVLDQDVMVTPI